jgi:ABC-type tungstate transport system substrate-binding protein
VPRVLNLMLAAVLLLLVAPIVTQFDGKRWYVQVVLLSVTVPTVLLALACLSSAARPGSLGRGVRRLRARRRR